MICMTIARSDMRALTTGCPCPTSSIPRVHSARLSKRPMLRIAAAMSDKGPEMSANDPAPPGFSSMEDMDTSSLREGFSIIESRDTVRDFATMDYNEICNSIKLRRNRIFLLMEEVRRLRIQERLKRGELNEGEEVNLEAQEYSSAIPYFPDIKDETLDKYKVFYSVAVAGLIIFGGLMAPLLEIKLGLGGESYAQVISRLHLPSQLAQVDPIVASFTGGGVGVLSALLIVEANNIKKNKELRCCYCDGRGYLSCGSCGGGGEKEGPTENSSSRCVQCSGTGQVMCPSCLCTGMKIATEHDPRIDPFQLR